jgi:hypothetical protein
MPLQPHHRFARSPDMFRFAMEAVGLLCLPILMAGAMGLACHIWHVG